MTEHGTTSGTPLVDVEDPDAPTFDLVREGARRDGVEIVHYEQRFTVPGTRAEKRVVRTIAAMFALTGIGGLAFLVVYAVWPFQYELGFNRNKWFTPLLGGTLALALFGLGMAMILIAKKLIPAEVAVQSRHDGASAPDEQRLTAATLLSAYDATGIGRRNLLKAAAALGALPFGAAVLAPFIGALIKDPRKDKALFTTAWGPDVRLVREDGSPITPADIRPGGIETVFPDVPGGATNEHADSPTLLVHLREADAAKAIKNQLPGYQDANAGNFFAYSKICTHAGCPASLFEQESNRLLCPCHQSQFDVTDHCRPVFGPASRPLPQLPIKVNADGYFVAKSDYKEAIGPAFWERPS
jgi:ubiquinol-cytochrome c reductase iron-sulfur subunit